MRGRVSFDLKTLEKGKEERQEGTHKYTRRIYYVVVYRSRVRNEAIINPPDRLLNDSDKNICTEIQNVRIDGYPSRVWVGRGCDEKG